MSAVDPNPRVATAACQPRWLPALLVAVCALANLLLQPRFLDDINPDGISYLGIAQKYLAGNWRDAVNAYWGPLLSWLLVPLLAAGLEPIVAARVLMGAACVGTSFAAWRLACRFALAPWLRAALLLAMLPALLNVACRDVTPDMLIAAFLLLYLAELMRADFGRRWRHGAACGLYGALAYLSKAYGFYFFLAHYATVCVLLILGQASARDRVRTARAAVAGGAVFMAVSGLWIAALGAKYDRVLVSSTGAYNLALAAAGSRGHPMHHLGFLAPPNDTAVSAWEDPTYLPLPEPDGARAPDRLASAATRLGDMLDLAIGHGPLAPVIVLLSLGLSAAGILRRRRAPPRPGLWIPLLALAIYCAGYALVLVEWRYIFLVAILLPLMGSEVLHVEGREWRDRLGARGGIWRLTGGVANLVVIALLLIPLARKPAKQLWRYSRYADGIPPRELAARLREAVPPGARIASNHHWGPSLATAFLLEGRYFGEPGDLPLDRVVPALRERRVTHYLVWQETSAERAALDGQAAPLPPLVEGVAVYVLD